MRPIAAALALLTIGAAPIREIPEGRFIQWSSASKAPLRFRSGGLLVAIDPLPCTAGDRIGDSTCRWDGYNNRAAVTVTAPGGASFTAQTNAAAASARVAVLRLRAGDARPAVMIDSDSGGSAGDSWVDVLVSVANRYRRVALEMAVPAGHDANLQGAVDDAPRDVSGDGIVDIVLEDPRFAYVFGCGACTPRPPVILSVVGGRSVDLSATPAVRAVFAADMARLRPRCFATGDTDRNGACAAYVADAARAGRFAAAWRGMLGHYRHNPQWGLWQDCRAPRDAKGACPAGASTHYAGFPASLRAFLVKTGYVTPDEAAAAPLG